MRTALLAIVAAAVPAVANAELPGRLPPGQGERVFLPPPPDDGTPPPEQVGTVSPIIYLERCKGGCTIYPSGVDDAKTLHSSIPDNTMSEYHLDEFENAAGQTGAAADQEWADVVKCVKEVYSPFAAQVTDVKPTGATSFHTNVVAGVAPQLGLSNSILGISPGVNCVAADNHITYTFANAHGGSGMSRIYHLCWTIAQETAHTYSLDHSYAWPDMQSACNDPMTYRSDCGGQKFFRNDSATCGEFSPRPCKCGSTQNAHLTLLSTFGPGTPITRPPTVSITLPAPNSTVVNGASVVALAGAQRGIKSVELWLNGYKWTTAKGAAFGRDGQPESSYSMQLPADVPDGIIDIVVKAKDDIEVTTASTPLTVTKGAPCTTADTCADGQRCDAGRCLWDPPTGAFGEECTYQQYCLTGLCAGTDAKEICTQSCVPGVGDSCPDAAYECLEQSPGHGVCWPKGEDTATCLGCSSVGSGAPPLLLGAFGLAFVLRRRRR